jgi:Putative RNA methylase family UPF0020
MSTPGGAALSVVLERCLGEAGYTPPLRSVPALLAVLVETGSEPLERAIARAGAAALEPVLAALPRVAAEQRPRLLALLARLASGLAEPERRTSLYGVLVSSLGESEPASRKWAARALGKLADPLAELPLLRALAAAPGWERKSLIDALGVVGGAESVGALRGLDAMDPELERRRDRALALVERRLLRGTGGAILLDRALGAPQRVLLRCRAGLAELLSDELCALGFVRPRPLGPLATAAGVEVEHAGTLGQLLAARTALDVALWVGLDPHVADPVERLALALSGSEALERMQRWTQGVPRFRVAWTDAGHRRARTWALAHALRRHTDRVLNDSQQALWTVRARADAQGELWLAPRLDPDPRFRYRVSDVPAASHPTIAAALARAAGVRADEVVWDPFVGSALELVERARLGPVQELWGSDVDAGALVAARANLDAAGYSAQLVQRSALEFAPAGVSLILSNPPMGRRVARDGSLAELLERFVQHAARVLRPGGRVVWLSPLGAVTERVARASGLEVSNGPDVDLGGFSARLQVLLRS